MKQRLKSILRPVHTQYNTKKQNPERLGRGRRTQNPSKKRPIRNIENKSLSQYRSMTSENQQRERTSPHHQRNSSFRSNRPSNLNSQPNSDREPLIKDIYYKQKVSFDKILETVNQNNSLNDNANHFTSLISRGRVDNSSLQQSSKSNQLTSRTLKMRRVVTQGSSNFETQTQTRDTGRLLRVKKRPTTNIIQRKNKQNMSLKLKKNIIEKITGRGKYALPKMRNRSISGYNMLNNSSFRRQMSQNRDKKSTVFLSSIDVESRNISLNKMNAIRSISSDNSRKQRPLIGREIEISSKIKKMGLNIKNISLLKVQKSNDINPLFNLENNLSINFNIYEYIKNLIINPHTVKNKEFIYAVTPESGDMYNLIPIQHKDIQSDKISSFFTISGKGVTRYLEGKAVEMITLEEWIQNRKEFIQLRNLPLVKKFQKIKFLTNWKRIITKFKKSYYKKNLEINLPFLDPKIRISILKIQDFCFYIQKMTYFKTDYDSSLSISELIKQQDKHFNEQKRIMNNIESEIKKEINDLVSSFIDEIFEIAFGGLTTHMQSGLVDFGKEETEQLDFLKIRDKIGKENEDDSNQNLMGKGNEAGDGDGDGDRDRDSVNYRDKQIQFLKKLHSLKIPFSIKELLRDSSEQLLRMPVYFDMLIKNSLLKCYENNLSQVEKYLKFKLNETPKIQGFWLPKKKQEFQLSKPFINVQVFFKDDYSTILSSNKREVSFKKLEQDNFNPFVENNGETDRSYGSSDSSDYYSSSETQEDVYRTPALDPIQKRSFLFDLGPNCTPKDRALPDCEAFQIEDLKNSSHEDFSEMDFALGKLESENEPKTSLVYYSITNPSQKCLKISPSLEDISHHYKSNFQSFIEVITVIPDSNNMSPNFKLFREIISIIDEGNDSDSEKKNNINLFDVLSKSKTNKDFNSKIDCNLQTTFSKIEEFLPSLDFLIDQQWRISNFKITSIIQEPINMSWLLEEYLTSLKIMVELPEEVIFKELSCGICNLDVSTLIAYLKDYQKSEVLKICEELLPNLEDRINNFNSWFLNVDEIISLPHSNLDNFVELKHRSNLVLQGILIIRDLLPEFHGIYKSLISEETFMYREDVEFGLKDVDLLISKYDQMLVDISKIETLIDSKHEYFNKELEKEVKKLTEQLDQLFLKSTDPSHLDDKTSEEDIEDMVFLFEDLDKEFTILKKRAKVLICYSEYLGLAHMSNFEVLGTVKNSISSRLLLWTTKQSFKEQIDEWQEEILSKVDIEEFDEFMEEISSLILQIEKNVPENSASTNLRLLLNQYVALSPILKSLNSPFLTKTHKIELSSIFKRALTNDKESLKKLENLTMTVQKLLELGIESYFSKIVKLHIKAMHEHNLRDQFTSCTQKWERVTIPFKLNEQIGNMALDDLTNFWASFEEISDILQQLLSNRHVKIIEHRVSSYSKNINKIKVIIERLVTVQKLFLFLDKIYSSSDSKNVGKVNQDQQNFETTGKQLFVTFKKIGAKTSAHKILQIRSLVDVIIRYETIFKGLTNNVNNFMRKKREHFSRLYLISDEELLQIMSKCFSNPLIINQYINKMFSSVKKLKIEDTHSQRISMLKSTSGENMEIQGVLITTKEPMELYLDQILKYSQNTVNKKIQEMYKEMVQDQQPQRYRAINTPVQYTSIGYLLYWFVLVENILKNQNLGQNDIFEQIEIDYQNLENLVDWNLNNSLKPIQRIRLQSLISCLLQLRENSNTLIINDIQKQSDFIWQNIMKYDFTTDKKSIQLCLHKMKFPYLNEFLASGTRMMITPLTQKYLSSILLSLHSRNNCLLVGPTDSGKTCTAIQLSVAMGRFMTQVSCQPSFGLDTMSRLIRGVLKSSTWLLFDNFMKLQSKVAYPLTQILQRIKMSCQENTTNKIQIQNKMTSISPNSAIFVTIPRSKSQLPIAKSLSEALRPLNFTQPDLEVLFSQFLVSNGFGDTASLSRMLMNIWEYVPTQVNQQYFKFTISMMVDIIKSAKDSINFLISDKQGDRSAADSQEGYSEKHELLKALIKRCIPLISEINQPKFEAVIRNFYGRFIDIQSDFRRVEKSISTKLKMINFSKRPLQEKSMLNTYLGIKMDRAVVLCGPHLSGKNTSLTICKQLLLEFDNTEIFEDKIMPGAYPIDMLCGKSLSQSTNKAPKSTIEHHYENNSHKLSGIFSEFIQNLIEIQVENASYTTNYNSRNQDETTKIQKKWMILDGECDSTWTENIITAIDSYPVYYSSSLNKVEIPSDLKFIFKATQLKDVSPSFVGRVSIINFEKFEIKWSEFLLRQITLKSEKFSWLKRPEFKEMLIPSFEEYFKSLLPSKNGLKFILNFTQNSTIRNVLRVFTCLVQQFGTGPKNDKDHSRYLLTMIFYSIKQVFGAFICSRQKVQFSNIILKAYLDQNDKIGNELRFDSTSEKYTIDIKEMRLIQSERLYSPLTVDMSQYDGKGQPIHTMIRILRPEYRADIDFYKMITNSGLNLLIFQGPESMKREFMIDFESKGKDLQEGKNETCKIYLEHDSLTSLVQTKIKKNLVQKYRNFYAPRNEGYGLIELENLNLPLQEESNGFIGELLRSIINSKSCIDHTSYQTTKFGNINFMGFIHQDYARNYFKDGGVLEEALFRSFIVTSFGEYSEEDLYLNFSYSLQKSMSIMFTNIPEIELISLGESIIQQTAITLVQFYKRLVDGLNSSKNGLYLINPLKRVQDLLTTMTSLRKVENREQWIDHLNHELWREFGDPISSYSHSEFLSELISQILNNQFKLGNSILFNSAHKFTTSFQKAKSALGMQSFEQLNALSFSKLNLLGGNPLNSTTSGGKGSSILRAQKPDSSSSILNQEEHFEEEEELSTILQFIDYPKLVIEGSLNRKRGEINNDLAFIQEEGVCYQNVSKIQNFSNSFNMSKRIFSRNNLMQRGFELFKGLEPYIHSICRILNRPQGNVILSGGVGLGQKSILHFSGYFVKQNVKEVQVDQFLRENLIKVGVKALQRRKSTLVILKISEKTNQNMMNILKTVVKYKKIENLYPEITQFEHYIQTSRIAKNITSNIATLIQNLNRFLTTHIHFAFIIPRIDPKLRIFLQQNDFILESSIFIEMKDWGDDIISQIANKYVGSTLKSVFLDSSASSQQGGRDSSTNQSEIEWTKKISDTLIDSYGIAKKVAKKYNGPDPKKLMLCPYQYMKVCNYFKNSYFDNKSDIEESRSKYKCGISRVQFIKTKISDLKIQFEALGPSIEEENNKLIENLEMIEDESIKIREFKDEIIQINKQLNKEKEVIQVKKEKAEKELESIQKYLTVANEALSQITRSNIGELKTFPHYPLPLQKVLQAVNLLLGDPSDFESSKLSMGEFRYLDRIKMLDPKQISFDTLDKLKEFTSSEDFNTNIIQKISEAGKGLCNWVLSVQEFAMNYNILKPKFEQVKDLDIAIESKESKINNFKEQLKETENKLEALKLDKDERTSKLYYIKEQREQAEKKLVKGDSLIINLDIENSKWVTKLTLLDQKEKTLLGDTILLANTLHYFGPLNRQCREEIRFLWMEGLKKMRIRFSEDFSISSMLSSNSTPLNQRNEESGLKENEYFVENLIMIKNLKIPTIIYDPNEQALNSIISSKKDSSIVSASKDPKLQEKLQIAFENGYYLILENFDGEITPIIDDVVKAEIFILDGIETISISGINFQYNENFKLILLTKNQKVVQNQEFSIDFLIINLELDTQLVSDELKDITLSCLSINFEAQQEQETNIKVMKSEIDKIDDEILKTINLSNDERILDDLEFYGMVGKSKSLLSEYNVERGKLVSDQQASDFQKDFFNSIRSFINLVTYIYITLNSYDGLSMGEESMGDFEGEMDSQSQKNQSFLKKIGSGIDDDDQYKIREYTTSEMNFTVYRRLFKLIMLNQIQESTAKIDKMKNLETQTMIVTELLKVIIQGFCPQDQLWFLTVVAIKKLKENQIFDRGLWSHIMSDSKVNKSSRKSLVLEDSEQIQGVWSSVKKLKGIIPHLKFEDLPRFTEAFTEKEGQILKFSIFKSLQKISQYTPLEHLAVFKQFIPENVGLGIEIFVELNFPGVNLSSQKISMLNFLKYSSPEIPLIVMPLSTHEMLNSLNNINLSEKITEKSKPQKIEIAYCSNINIFSFKEYIAKQAHQGSILCLVDVDRVPDLFPKIVIFLNGVKSNKHIHPNFRLILSVSSFKKVDFLVAVTSFNYRFGQEMGPVQEFVNFHQQVERDTWDNSFPRTVVSCRRNNAILNGIYFMELMSSRSKIQSKGFLDGICIDSTDVSLLLHYLNNIDNHIFEPKINKNRTDYVLEKFEEGIYNYIFMPIFGNELDRNIARILLKQQYIVLRSEFPRLSLCIQGEGIVLSENSEREIREIFKCSKINFMREAGLIERQIEESRAIESEKTENYIKSLKDIDLNTNKKSQKIEIFEEDLIEKQESLTQILQNLEEQLPSQIQYATLTQRTKYFFMVSVIEGEVDLINGVLRNCEKMVEELRDHNLEFESLEQELINILRILVPGERVKELLTNNDSKQISDLILGFKDKVDYFNTLLFTANEGKFALNPKRFKNPRAVFQALRLDLLDSRSFKLAFDDIKLSFKSLDVFEMDESLLNIENIVFYGMEIQNGYWNKISGIFQSNYEPGVIETLPCFTLVPHYLKEGEEQVSQDKQRVCPIYTSQSGTYGYTLAFEIRITSPSSADQTNNLIKDKLSGLHVMLKNQKNDFFENSEQSY